MTKHTQVEHFNKFVMQMAETMLSKGDDYSKGDADRLSNFKLAGAITGISAKMNCLNMIATKVARLGILLNSENAPKNESIKDSVLDLACYSALLDMLIADGE